MRPKTPKRWKKGDPITAQRLNEMLDLIMRLDITVPNGNFFQLQQSATGTVLSADLTGYAFLAIANGSIPARSGTACGVGSVYKVLLTPSFTSGNLTGVTLTTSSIAIDVVNPSATTMSSTNGIDSGQYCWVQMDDSGLYMVTPLECA